MAISLKNNSDGTLVGSEVFLTYANSSEIALFASYTKGSEDSITIQVSARHHADDEEEIYYKSDTETEIDEDGQDVLVYIKIPKCSNYQKLTIAYNGSNTSAPGDLALFIKRNNGYS